MAEKESKKTLLVDEDVCIGCGTCESVAPDHFKIVDGVSKVVKAYSDEDTEVIEDAIANCPVSAITLK